MSSPLVRRSAPFFSMALTVLMLIPVRLQGLAFPVPVHGVIHDINIVREALLLLNQWPKPQRGPVYSCAVRSCNAASAGQMTTDQARKAFVGFARLPW